MPPVPGLRGPYETTGGLYYFARMIDKIRLHAAGKLPESYAPYLGAAEAFDGRCCRFLGIDYAAFAAEARKGGSDGALLEWAFARGRRPSEEEIKIWNNFMSKRGWRDEARERLLFRLEEGGFPPDAALTSFDYLDLDEGRPPRFPATS